MMRWFRRRSASDAQPSCEQVMEVLQSYLDGETDAATARAVAVHLEMCVNCGPEARVFRDIKQSLARKAEPVDPAVLAGLEAFGRRLISSELDH